MGISYYSGIRPKTTCNKNIAIPLLEKKITAQQITTAQIGFLGWCFSIGIELEGEDETPYGDRQYTALVETIKALLCAYPSLSVRRIAAHSDIAPGRKTDPGPAFDWLRLYDGLSDALPSG